MSNRFTAIVNGLLLAAIFAVAALAIYRIPAGAQVAIHWGPDKRPDAWLGGSAIHLINLVGLPAIDGDFRSARINEAGTDIGRP